MAFLTVTAMKTSNLTLKSVSYETFSETCWIFQNTLKGKTIITFVAITQNPHCPYCDPKLVLTPPNLLWLE
jgi:hypothetical protein